LKYYIILIMKRTICT